MKVHIILILIFIFFLQCCLVFGQDSSNYKIIDLGVISFRKKSHKLTEIAKKRLDRIVIIMNKYPGSDLNFVSHTSDFCDKCGVLSWDRSLSIYSYLIKRGVPEERLQSNDILDGNQNYINLSFVPHIEIPPNLDRSKLNLRNKNH